MNSLPQHEKVSDLMERAEAAMRRSRWFEAERMAQRSLEIARREEDFEAMARITLRLLEARRQRVQNALDSKKLRTIEGDISDEMPLAIGCYLVQPPAVGADARRLRLAALRREIPACVLCREPRTQMGLCPIVAIGQTTVRVRIEAPRNWEKPDLRWFASAMEELGNGAIEALDTGLELDRQIDYLLEALDAVPDHEKLHQLLETKCREAMHGFVRSRPVDALEEELEGMEDAEVAEDGTIKPKRAASEDED